MSCSTGINHFKLTVFFVCSIEEKPFLFSLNDQLFQLVTNQVETVEKSFSDDVTRLKFHRDYSHYLTHFTRKRLEKCSFEKRQPYQPKPVVVETVDPNRNTTSLTLNYCISNIVKRN